MRVFAAMAFLAIASEARTTSAHSLEVARARAAGNQADVAGLSAPAGRLTAALPKVNQPPQSALPAAAPKVSRPQQSAEVARPPREPGPRATPAKKGLLHEVHAFLQRSTAHKQRRQPPASVQPRAVEEMETIWGVPKIVWVILADVLAMAGFLACIPFVMFLAKRRRPEMGNGGGSSEQGGLCGCLCGDPAPKMQAYPPAMSGNPGFYDGGHGGGYMPQGGYNQGYNPGSGYGGYR